MNPSDKTTRPALVFIYGTLKRGHCRAAMLAGQRFLGTARTAPNYRLVNCGTYPGLVPAAPGLGIAVLGEVWEVDRDCLAALDAEEGIDAGLYQRAGIDLEGHWPHVEGYLYLRDTTTLHECGNCWTLEFEQSVLGRR